MLNVLTLIELTEKQKELVPNVNFFNKQDLEKTPDQEIDLLITWPYTNDNDLLRSLKGLKYIQSGSAGVNYLDLDYIIENNIQLTNGRGLFSKPIAQTILAYALNLYRGINLSFEDKQNKKWDQHDGKLDSLENKKILIFGTGSISTETYKLFSMFTDDIVGVNRSGKTTEYFNRVEKMDSLTEEVFDADFIISTLPETPETIGIFNKEFFSKFMNKPIFINIGRGTSTDENVLVELIKNGHLSGLGLDVFQTEPLNSDSPLWELENTIITPHNSGYTKSGTTEALLKVVAKNVDSIEKTGKVTENIVDPKAGY